MFGLLLWFVVRLTVQWDTLPAAGGNGWHVDLVKVPRVFIDE